MTAIRNLSKLPKRKVTVDELLGYDNIIGMASELIEEADNIEELIIIKTLKNTDIITYETNGLMRSKILWLLESIKQLLLERE